LRKNYANQVRKLTEKRDSSGRIRPPPQSVQQLARALGIRL
jgi:hypothetical protein